MKVFFPKSFSMGELTWDSFSEKKSFLEGNNGVMISEYLFLHKNHIKNVKINFLKSLKISKGLQQSKENLFKKSSRIWITILSFVAFWFGLFSSLFFLYYGGLGNHYPCKHSGSQQPSSHCRGKTGFGIYKSNYENCHRLIFFGHPWRPALPWHAFI